VLRPSFGLLLMAHTFCAQGDVDLGERGRLPCEAHDAGNEASILRTSRAAPLGRLLALRDLHDRKVVLGVNFLQEGVHREGSC
jgi:hypothetical protein